MFCTRRGRYTTRWSTIRSSKVNLTHTIKFRVKLRHVTPWNCGGARPAYSTVRTDVNGLISTATSLQKCETIPRRALMQGLYPCVSLNSRLKSNNTEEESGGADLRGSAPCIRFTTTMAVYNKSVTTKGLRFTGKGGGADLRGKARSSPRGSQLKWEGRLEPVYN